MYDKSLSYVFFKELQFPRPDLSLYVGSATHMQQNADFVMPVKKALMSVAAALKVLDRMIVFGIVNSTLAEALAAAKLCISRIFLQYNFPANATQFGNKCATEQL